MLVLDGRPLELAAHLRRLESSLDHLYGASVPQDAAPLVLDGARGLEIGRLRLTASPSDERTGVDLEVTAAAIDAAIVCPPWERGPDLRARTVAGWRGGHKWVDRRLLEALEAETAPAAALLVDESGAVLETTRSNVFVVRADGRLATPPADGRILPGLMRMRVVETARTLGIEVVEDAVTRADTASAREVFVTNSLRGVEPVRSLDGSPIGHPDRSLADTIAADLRERWLSDLQRSV